MFKPQVGQGENACEKKGINTGKYESELGCLFKGFTKASCYVCSSPL